MKNDDGIKSMIISLLLAIGISVGIACILEYVIPLFGVIL